MKRRFFALFAALMLLQAPWSALGAETVVIPEIPTKEMEIPDNEAMRFVRDMKAGWNLGNTFDAVDCTWLPDPLDYETGWCGVRTSRELIEALYAAGFRTIRIPVSWHNHLSADLTVDASWMDRVEEVVSWALERGMYVILNIHHDCSPSFYYPDSAHYESSERYMRTVWSQIAERFRDCDAHLIFEGINEPRLTGTGYEWWWTEAEPACQDAMVQIVKLNQVFVDTVRASGGRNADRYLMVPSYAANPEYACRDAFTLPSDSADNRIIVSVHAYTPYDFALEQPGTDSFSLDNSKQKSVVAMFLSSLYTKYVANGIPVVIGEFGAMEKNGNLQARVDWLSFYAAQARSRGITCCWWDNNCFSGNGERFGLFDRTAARCAVPELLEAFMKNCE